MQNDSDTDKEKIYGCPDKLRIVYEPFDYSWFDHIGRLDDGTQFMAFVTGAFLGQEHYPASDSETMQTKRWVAVIHYFDAEGSYLRSEARMGGLDTEGRVIAGEKAEEQLDRMLAELKANLCDIYIKPFYAEIDGIYHELVCEYHEDNENGSECEYVMLWPNDIMFHPPWDSGEYST